MVFENRSVGCALLIGLKRRHPFASNEMTGSSVRSQKIRIVLLGFWLGAMSLFSFIAAPAAFAVLPEPRLAGDVVNRVLGGTEIIGVALGAILLLALLFSGERRSRAFLFELSILAMMTFSMIVSRFAVSKSLHELRLKYGDQLSTLPRSDPARVGFDQLHQYSVWLMGLTMIAAMVLIVMLIARSNDKHKP
jgi:hypothetical protein